MTKEEALKILKDCRQRGFDRTTYYIDEYHTARDMAIRALEEQETVELSEHVIDAIANAVVKKMQEPKWIPVSERMPEVNQRVLVTSYGRVCYAMMISADGNSGHPVFKLQDSLNEKVVCETTVHNKFTTSRITAWMPLPEPYKAESEG
jgi:hypothetical protein